jgi:phosphoribosylanthranilate isomerase
MFQIKICGITSEDDAKAAVDAGADAVGLNFYPKSPRFVTRATAERILQILPARIVKVGLFVNEEVEAVAKAFDDLWLDLIQLHGTEPPDYILQLGHRKVMKVFRMGGKGIQPIEDYLEDYVDAQVDVALGPTGNLPTDNLSCLLLDSCVKGVYGGSGITGDWAACAEFAVARSEPPLVLAGGLTPENVGEAICRVRPAAVDAASGVETSPGRKDRRLMTAFVENARRAFLSIGG